MDGLDVSEGIHVRISNANEQRIPIEEMIIFVLGSVSVKGLVVGNDAPERELGEEVESRRKTSRNESL